MGTTGNLKWVCDRCGVTASVKADAPLPSRPPEWTRVKRSGLLPLDLCGDCSGKLAAFVDGAELVKAAPSKGGGKS